MKIYKRLMIIAFTIAVSNAIAQTNSGDTAAAKLLAEARAAIARGNALWIEGWKNGDATLVASIFETDGIQLSLSGKIIKGREQILERQQAAMKGADPGVIVTIVTEHIWVNGETAYETGKYKYEYKEKGKPGVDEGRYVTIWKRQSDGAWKLSMDMGLPKE